MPPQHSSEWLEVSVTSHGPLKEQHRTVKDVSNAALYTQIPTISVRSRYMPPYLTILICTSDERIQPVLYTETQARALDLAQGGTPKYTQSALRRLQTILAMPYRRRHEYLCRKKWHVEGIRQVCQNRRSRCVNPGAFWRIWICEAGLEEDTKNMIKTWVAHRGHEKNEGALTKSQPVRQILPFRLLSPTLILPGQLNTLP